MAPRAVVRMTTTEVLQYRVPHTRELIFYDLYVDAGNLTTEYIRCDLCEKPLRLHGSPGHRTWSNLDGHRRTKTCLDKRRANQRASALETERQARAEAQVALASLFSRQGPSYIDSAKTISLDTFSVIDIIIL